MGTSGFSIFSDDLAADLRNEFKDLIGDGKSPQEATKEIIGNHHDSINDYDEGPVFWIALAATQWRLGVLQEEVKTKALDVIDSGAGLVMWTDPKDKAKRAAVLQKLKEQLLSPQPPVKKVPKTFRENTPYEVGDVLRYRTTNDKYVLFRVIGHHDDIGGHYPICELLDWIGTNAEISEKEINQLSIMRRVAYKSESGADSFMIASGTVRNFPADRITLVMKRSKPQQSAKGNYLIEHWKSIEQRVLKNVFGIEI